MGWSAWHRGIEGVCGEATEAVFYGVTEIIKINSPQSRHTSRKSHYFIWQEYIECHWMCIFGDFQPIRPSSPFRVLRLAGWWTGLLQIHVRSTRAWHVSSLPALPGPWCCAFYSTPTFPLRHSLAQHPSASPSRCANQVMSYHQLGGDTGMTSDDEIVWSVSVWWPGPDPPYRQALTLLLLPLSVVLVVTNHTSVLLPVS